MSDPPALEADGLALRFEGKALFAGLSFAVRRGEMVCLSGESGAGKSSVLRCMLGFVPPAAGTIRIEGRTLDERSVWELRRRVAYVQQEPDLGQDSVRATLERPFRYRANAGLRGNLERAQALFERFGLAPALMNENVETLSGGEKQRVALVAALLLDEPSSALDSAAERAVLAAVRGEAGKAVLCVAHDAVWTQAADTVVAVPPANGPGGLA